MLLLFLAIKVQFKMAAKLSQKSPKTPHEKKASKTFFKYSDLKCLGARLFRDAHCIKSPLLRPCLPSVFFNLSQKDVYIPEPKHFLGVIEVKCKNIYSSSKWLDFSAIQKAHTYLHAINILIQEFQWSTLGPVRYFNIITGVFRSSIPETIIGFV